MTEKYDVEPEQAIALEELEKLVGKTIPIVEKTERNTFGFKIEDDNVTGLGLCDQGLSTLPESIGNLIYCLLAFWSKSSKRLKYMNHILVNL